MGEKGGNFEIFAFKAVYATILRPVTLLNRLSGSIIAKAKIACVLVSSVLILDMNRVITATHDFPNVGSNTHYKLTISADKGHLKRSGAVGASINQYWSVQMQLCTGAREGNQFSIKMVFPSRNIKQLYWKIWNGMKNMIGLKFYLLNRLSGSIFAKAKIACVLVSSVLILDMNRVITAIPSYC
ncbi:MAG: hypothetical protein JNN05_02295 [Candidatus Omnitrophica bacterium]|nr:hypothetical protein [Candidatus Omnitrophota bacterium]